MSSCEYTGCLTEMLYFRYKLDVITYTFFRKAHAMQNVNVLRPEWKIKLQLSISCSDESNIITLNLTHFYD